MMTVITYVRLHEGAEPEWDRIMRERLTEARGRDGWISGQLLMPLDAMNRRVIVGTWTSRAAWEAWHQDPAFTVAAARLDELQAEASGPQWHEVTLRVRSPRALRVVKRLTERAIAAAPPWVAHRLGRTTSEDAYERR